MSLVNRSNNLLDGKRALITGSTSGIGLSLAKSLAAQGTRIILNGFSSPSELQQCLQEVGSLNNNQVSYEPADMSKPTEIEQMMKRLNQQGGVDILVNNAGIQFVSSIETLPVEKWDSIIAINLSSSFHTIRHVLAPMREKNWGRIINIASVHGLVASKDKSAYVAAKHGLVGLTKTVALETAQTGITCNAICPGFVLTPLLDTQIKAKANQLGESYEEGTKALLQEKQPSLSLVTTQQIGSLAVYLCSDAANQIRGAAWNIDGGWVAQ
jgi:3-hydroxybutyrate dehydrogenase